MAATAPAEEPAVPFESDLGPIPYSFTILEKYDKYKHDIILDLRTFADKFPRIANVSINNTAADLILTHLYSEVSPSDMRLMHSVIDVSDVKIALDNAVGLTQSPAAKDTVKSVCAKFINEMKPKSNSPKFMVSEKELLDNIHTLKKVLYKFFYIITDTIHHNKFSSVHQRLKYRLITKLKRDRWFVIFLAILLASIIVVVILLVVERTTKTDRDYHEDAETAAIISCIWILYNFIFD